MKRDGFSTDITRNKKINEIKNVIRQDADQFIEYERIKDRRARLVADIVEAAAKGPGGTPEGSQRPSSGGVALSF